jgi:hypothetical protein
MPIGLAGRATAGRLSGAGTTPGFLRVGLGVGVASAGTEADADVAGSAVGIADSEADGEGVARTDGDAVGDGLGATDPSLLGVLVGPAVDGSGEPTGAVVHPARTPAHTSALRAIAGSLTSSG